MKLLNPRDKFLTNYEVLAHLNEIKTKNNWTFKPEEDTSFSKKKKRFTACGLDLEVITRDLTSYLDSSPCSEIKDIDTFKQLLQFLNQFDLMKIEKLQIVNTLPRNMVSLYAVVEEFDLRFEEEACDSIIGKINELFPVEEQEGEVQEGEMQEEEQHQEEDLSMAE